MKDAEVSKINLLEEENKLLKTEVMKLKTECYNVLQNLEEKKSELSKENQIRVTVCSQIQFHIADLQLTSSKPEKEVKSAIKE